MAVLNKRIICNLCDEPGHIKCDSILETFFALSYFKYHNIDDVHLLEGIKLSCK